MKNQDVILFGLGTIAILYGFIKYKADKKKGELNPTTNNTNNFSNAVYGQSAAHTSIYGRRKKCWGVNLGGVSYTACADGYDDANGNFHQTGYPYFQ